MKSFQIVTQYQTLTVKADDFTVTKERAFEGPIYRFYQKTVDENQKEKKVYVARFKKSEVIGIISS
jgi:hypothetical protein